MVYFVGLLRLRRWSQIKIKVIFFNDLSVHSTWTIKISKILTLIFTDCKGPPYDSLRFERVSEIFSHLKKFLKKTNVRSNVI